MTALASRVLTLRTQGATLDTTLNAVRPTPTSPFYHISASDLTTRIRAVLHLHPDPAYTIDDVSVRSTRAGGAMALLCAGVDSDRLRMIGRWRSDEMFRYLHVQAHPVMNGLSAAMLCGGDFRLIPAYFSPPSFPPFDLWPPGPMERYPCIRSISSSDAWLTRPS